MIKIVLSIIICSQVANTCLEPHVWPTTFDTQYDCLMYGYEESKNKTIKIGRSDVNKFDVYVKFVCAPLTET